MKAARAFISKNTKETLDFAFEFASALRAGDIVLLNGELGAGKTVFVKGIAKFLNIKDEIVSPTFTLMNRYEGGSVSLYHFDLYRIRTDAELAETGLYDILGTGVSVIEWNKFQIAAPVKIVDIAYISENARKISVYEK